MSILNELTISTAQTLYMVGASALISLLFGIPLGVLLLLTSHSQLHKTTVLNRLISSVVNVIRSIPFIILMVAMIPITRLLIGTSIGSTAAVVSLSVAAIVFYARIVEAALNTSAQVLVEAGVAMGAAPLQIVVYLLLPQSAPELVRGFTLTVICLIGYCAMAGAIGGGGLGDFAIRYGYQRFNTPVMLITLVVLVVMVQIAQWLGDRLAQHLTRSSDQ